MDSKVLGSVVIIALIAGGAGFWGGMKYSSGQSSARGSQFGQFNGGQGGRGGNRGGGAAFGSIISKDENSVTIKLGQGGASASSTNGSTSGTKIVILSSSTEVGKTVAGSVSDLAVGDNVVVNGTPNSDGSITAAMVQIRPANMPGFGGPRGGGGPQQQ